MKKSLVLSIVMLLVLSLVITACGGQSASSDPEAGNEDGDKKIKIAKVSGLLGDNGFNDEAHAGMMKAEEELGIEFDYVEYVDEAEIETHLRSFAETGEYDLIITVGATHADAVKMVAPDYPDQKFSLIDSLVDGIDNVSSVGAKDPEQAFLSGVISGIVTTGEYKDVFPFSNDANMLSYAGGTDAPTSRAGAVGFMAGAKYVNPDVDIHYTIIGGYNDPVKAKEVALSDIARGADIVTGNCGAGSMGLIAAAKESDAYVITTSMSNTDYDNSLCTSVKLVDKFVYDEIESIVNGSWESGATRKGIAEGICDVSLSNIKLENDFPQEILDIVDEIRQKVADGEFELPQDVDELDEWVENNQYEW